MENTFSIENIKSLYPDAVVTKNGVDEIDYHVLSLILAQELNDIQDQLNEKDYQILRITERLDVLEDTNLWA